ncbi:hypothetical protein [Donghicola eburneus]|uniref:Uncharacterized protein n=1 Tax=Donghicola eburneus TaxID=393278 RepID=A0A1M4MWH8_9RHOB|nr:hypothetical protein [Donghicola eburneus]SCM66901.1 hypothetical protein KARMA_1083 [Donghicola eburneus]SFQ61459.1 hypothetical protein SAMN05421764_107178 [Donghicola eburneus]
MKSVLVEMSERLWREGIFTKKEKRITPLRIGSHGATAVHPKRGSSLGGHRLPSLYREIKLW